MSKGNTKKKHKGLKIFAIFLLVIAIIVLLVAGGAFYFINDKIGKMQKLILMKEIWVYLQMKI